MSLVYHWDSERSWLEVPRALFDEYCGAPKRLSERTRYDDERGTLFLDYNTDGKVFIEAYVRRNKIAVCNLDHKPEIFRALRISMVHDGVVSVIRSKPRAHLTVIHSQSEVSNNA